MIQASTLRIIAPKARLDLDALAAALSEWLPRHEIDTPLRAAHFLAQGAHETDGFRTLVEYASGEGYERRTDLGNVNRGDGPRYRGRGVFQLTGRANYRRIGEQLGINLESEPEHAAEPVLSVRIACLYWTDRRINVPADADDLEGVTRKINGGLRGLADRRRYLEIAKPLLI